MQGKHQLVLTYGIVAVITAACLMMAGPMRGGFPVGNELGERMQFIVDNLGLWRAGWYLWMLSALGLLTFCTLLAQQVNPGPLRTLGLTLVAIGIAPDLMAEVIYSFILPQAIAVGASQLALIEQLAMFLTGFLGNGLYNLGGMLLTLLLIRQRTLARWIAVSGLISWSLGLGLSAAVAVGNMALTEFFTATAMVCSTLWMLIIAHTLFNRADLQPA